MFSYILSFTPAGKYESHHMECHGPQPHTTAQNWKTHPKYQLKNSPYARQHNLMKSRVLAPPGKKMLSFTHSQILSPHNHQNSNYFYSAVWQHFLLWNLFPPCLPFFRISLIPLRALFFRFLFIVLSAHCLLSVILPKAEVKVLVFKNLFCLGQNYLLNCISLPILLIQIYVFIWIF